MTRHDDRHGSRMLRLTVISLTVLLIAVLTALTIISALLSTSRGSGWVVDRLSAALNSDTQSLRIGATQGTLLWGMTLRDVRYETGANVIQAQALRSRWNPFTLLSGEFSLDLLQITAMKVTWHSSQEVEESEAAGDPLADILPLPIDIRLQEFILRDASIDFDGQVQLIDSLQFSASLQDKHLRVEDLLLEAAPLQLSGAAQIDLVPAYPLQADLNWRYSQTIAEGIEGANGNLVVTGDLNTLSVEHELLSPALIDSQGTVTLGPDYRRFDLQHEIPAQQLPVPPGPEGSILRINAARITTSGWTDSLTVSGLAEVAMLTQDGEPLLPTVTLSWNTLLAGQTLAIEQLSASTPTGTLNASGDVSWQDGLDLGITYDLREQDASAYQALLPAALAPGALASTGNIALHQAGESYEGVATIDSLAGDLNGYPLSGAGVFNFTQDSYELTDVRLSSAGNQLEIAGRWADVIDLDWQLQAPALDTLSPLLSGSLNAQGNIAGTPDLPRLSLDADGSNIVYDTIHIGAVTMDGSYSDGRNIVAFSATDIAPEDKPDQRIDSLNIVISGQPAQHNLELILRSPLARAELAFAGGLSDTEPGLWEGQLQRGSISSELGTWRAQPDVALRLSAAEATVAEHCWNESGSQLCLAANWKQSGELQARAELRNYPLAVFNPVPQGENDSEFETTFIPHLASGSTLEGILAAEFSANGRITDNPEDLALNFSMSTDNGQINVTTIETAEEVAASASIQTPAPEPEIQEFHWRTASLRGTRENNSWAMNAAVDFYQPNLVDTGMAVQGAANAQLAIAPDQSLDGTVNLSFDDLSWIEAFTPQVEDPQGELSGRVTVAGTISAPVIGGNLGIANAALRIPALGLELTGLNTTLTSNGGEQLTLDGTVSSGDGTLRFESEVLNPLSEERTLSLTLVGENFELASLPELHLAIAPDMAVTAGPTGIDISGTLNIPVLDVAITTLPESAVNVSADTILVSQPVDEPEIRNAAQSDRGIFEGIPMTGRLQVVLGDDVRFTGFGLHTQLAGTLDITQRETGAPLTYGELTVVEGSYQTYGRTLTIEHGKLLFFGSYDNPALDIRAVRQTEDVKVGVQMNGTLRSIRSQLFSTPTLPDGDIIAVMLTGRPFAELDDEDSNALIGAVTSLGISQGQSLTNQIRNKLGLDTLSINSTGDTANSSLTLGKYLTPKIFIRYGVGLFETESTLAVDYSVTDRVKLEAKSGSTQSIDLTYTVEK